MTSLGSQRGVNPHMRQCTVTAHVPPRGSGLLGVDGGAGRLRDFKVWQSAGPLREQDRGPSGTNYAVGSLRPHSAVPAYGPPAMLPPHRSPDLKLSPPTSRRSPNAASQSGKSPGQVRF